MTIVHRDARRLTGLLHDRASFLLSGPNQGRTVQTHTAVWLSSNLDGDLHNRSGVVFSPNGRQYACGAKRDNKWMILVDGQEGPLYDDVNGNLLFSPDGRRFAYAAKLNGKWRIVIDKQESPPYEDILSPGLFFSPDSRRFAYCAKSNTTWAAVVDGQQGLQYEGFTSDVLFSPCSEHFIFIAKSGTIWNLVINGREEPIHTGIVRGGKIVFNTEKKCHLLVVDGQRILRVDVDLP